MVSKRDPPATAACSFVYLYIFYCLFLLVCSVVVTYIYDMIYSAVFPRCVPFFTTLGQPELCRFGNLARLAPLVFVSYLDNTSFMKKAPLVFIRTWTMIVRKKIQKTF